MDPPTTSCGNYADEAEASTYDKLKNCNLVARSWTYHLHKNLFEIMFTISKGEGIHNLVLPAANLLRSIKSLVMDVVFF